MAKSTYLVTGNGRLIWPSLWEMTSGGIGKPCYECTLMFPHGSEGATALQVAAEKAAEDAWPDIPWDRLKNWPVKDGDIEKPQYQNFKGQTYAKFKSMRRPVVKDNQGNILFDPSPEIVYPGCFARVAYTCYAYETKEKGSVISRGVSFWFTGLQKTADGEAFGQAANLDELLPAVTAADLEDLGDLLS